jgi:chromosome segregation ATPase
MEVEDAQLAKPNFDFVRQLYENLVVLLVGVSREEMQQPVFNAIDCLQFPELHDNSIPNIVFSKNLSKLMNASGLQDFSLVKDLYKPESARLRRNLSAIINFAKFREEKLSLFTELQDQSDGLSTKMAALKGEHSKLSEEVSKYKEIRDGEKEDMLQLEQETIELEASLRGLNKEQAVLQSEIRSSKNVTKEVSDKVQEEKFKLLEEKKKKEELKSRIVLDSPGKMQKVLKEIEDNIENERQCIVDVESRARDASHKLETLCRSEKDLLKLTKLMEDVEKDMAKYKETNRKVKQANTQIVSNESDLITLGSQEQHLKRQQNMLSERFGRLQQQFQLKVEATASSVENQQRNKENAQAEHITAQQKLSNNEALCKSYQDKTRELKQGHAQEIHALNDKYNQLCNQVQEYHKLLVETMEAK